MIGSQGRSEDFYSIFKSVGEGNPFDLLPQMVKMYWRMTLALEAWWEDKEVAQLGVKLFAVKAWGHEFSP